MTGPYTTCSTPTSAFSLLRETLSESAAIASAAHDWDVLDALLGITLALQALADLELMVAERDAALLSAQSDLLILRSDLEVTEKQLRRLT